MDPRLEEASHAGDLEALHRLLQEDSLILAQFSTTPPTFTNNPLHIAALIRHADFVREVLRLNPTLARDTNTNGLTPLHLASAKGRLAVVRELLSVSGGSDLCGICDGDGLLPIHTAAAKGRTEVLVELINASPDSVRQLTRRGETTLHWAIRSGCYKAVEVLVESIGIDEESFLNSKDDEGNTIIHIAASMRQFQIVKMLLTRRGIEFNKVNARGLTVLDVLLGSPNESRDLALIEMILAAGGNTASGRESGSNQPSQSSPARTFQYFLGLSLWMKLGDLPNHALCPRISVLSRIVSSNNIVVSSDNIVARTIPLRPEFPGRGEHHSTDTDGGGYNNCNHYVPTGVEPSGRT